MLEDYCDEWREVESSNIAAVGTKDHWLIVLFNNNAAYRYANMSCHFNDLIFAESVGKYFAKNIRHESCERLIEGAIWED